MKEWDAIVVGAGPAGCACACDLASAGRSVLLLDKSEFPRMKACAGGLTMKTVRALRYSIAPVVR
jgi:flavin-dependent dehydrogenase